MDAIRVLWEPYRIASVARFAFLKNFRQKVPLQFSRGHFLVKTVATADELEQALALRYQVFHREYQKKWLPIGHDSESLDQVADHLVIIDTRSQRVVGTYRLLSSLHTSRFYSQSEFYLDRFLREPGVKLELSRACVARDYRTGVVMSLLWRGVSEYLTAVGAKYLFGCSSVKSQSLATAQILTQEFFQRGVLHTQWGVEPVLGFRLPGWYGFDPDRTAKRRGFADETISEAKSLLPPLLTLYLKMGASVAPEPAWDREFKCLDYLTVLPMAKLEAGFERRYR